jgi:NAD(P)-dependent dehydrogenase (short-subunit alcohol dehydrogenase family)
VSPNWAAWTSCRPVHPTNVDTDMIQNAGLYELFAPDLPEAERTKENLVPRFAALTALGIPWVEPVDISNAVLWLASDESRYVTGITLPIDAGQTIKSSANDDPPRAVPDAGSRNKCNCRSC